MDNLLLFTSEEAPLCAADSDSLVLVEETPYERAHRRIAMVLSAGHPVALAFSSGKDSSALASITLDTARTLVLRGLKLPPILVIHSDTGVEQPEIKALARAEIRRMQAYAEEHGFTLQAFIGQPKLNESWPVRVLSGRALPSFPDTRADCTTDLKIKVNEASIAESKKAMAKKFPKPPVLMTGVRLDESIARNQRIAKRQEQADRLWSNDKGDLRISPLLDWQSDDVWEYLGRVQSGEFSSYSDFDDVFRIYRDSGGSSCVVVADLKGQGTSKPCGVRTGCWVCTRVAEDKSMSQMIESDPKRYGHLKPLANLRDFISRTQYDWSLRHWVGRTIKDGSIEIAPDSYSPDMLQRLLRYTLSAQRLSGVEIVSIPALIAIDARWSLYGLLPPFTALKIYFEVIEGGQIELAPQVMRNPKTLVPRLGRIDVGHDSYLDAGHGLVRGLRDVAMEMHAESCPVDLKTLANGHVVVDYCNEDAGEVDEEGAYLFLDLEAERHIEEYCHYDCSDWTVGFTTYLRYGTVTLAKGRSTQTNDIMARTQWRQRHQLHGQRTAEELESRLTHRYPQQIDLVLAA